MVLSNHAGSSCAPKLHIAVTKKTSTWQFLLWGLEPSLTVVRKRPCSAHGIPWTTIWACDKKEEELADILIPNLSMQSFRICRWDWCFLKVFLTSWNNTPLRTIFWPDRFCSGRKKYLYIATRRKFTASVGILSLLFFGFNNSINARGLQTQTALLPHSSSKSMGHWISTWSARSNFRWG